jgi:hypothetical protein
VGKANSPGADKLNRVGKFAEGVVVVGTDPAALPHKKSFFFSFFSFFGSAHQTLLFPHPKGKKLNILHVRR